MDLCRGIGFESLPFTSIIVEESSSKMEIHLQKKGGGKQKASSIPRTIDHSISQYPIETFQHFGQGA